jgi:hypothetical protein
MSDTTATNRPLPTAPDEDGPDEGLYTGDYRRSAGRKKFVLNVVPILTSLGIHLGLVGVALALLVTVREVIQTGPVLEQATVGTTKLATENVGAMPNVGNVDDVTRQNASLDPVAQSSDFREQGVGDAADLLAATTGGATSASMTGITGMGELSNALGGGGGEGSPLFGEAGGGQGFMGLDTGTAGDGGDVYRIAFVCDSSGSMGGEPQFLLFQELKNAVEPLEVTQQFNVVFFSGDDYRVAFPGELKPATGRFKDQMRDFLDGIAMDGNTNPVPALRAAFEMRPQPQLIFFLTDGQFDGIVSYEDVINTIDQLREQSSAPPIINTIQFINRNERAEEVLQDIARRTGGEYVFVGRDFFGG